MPLKTIYVVRHGYRSNWTTDPISGETSSTVPSPTNIPSDPALSAYGVQQAAQLAELAKLLEPPVARIYTSPFFRCVQTITPFAERLTNVPLICDRGLGEWYGTARFTHPSPAPLEILRKFFPTLMEKSTLVPSANGESIAELHDRTAFAVTSIIAECDTDSAHAETAILICTHAATMISLGRVLTGIMPEDVNEQDFHAYTCSISTFERKKGNQEPTAPIELWRPGQRVPDVGWRGNGVLGGWRCLKNADTTHLSGGGERGWHFSGEESFIEDMANEAIKAESTKRQCGTVQDGVGLSGVNERGSKL
ncbi:hypothetical protein MMC13_004105 [Lambiella insularis]|nr:hypothetical protein [Lambiella insularis]